MIKNIIEACTIINGKKAQGFINNYDYVMRKYGCRDLDNCYGSYSYLKYRAFDCIRNECDKNGGHGLTITTYNCNIFTCAYLVEIDGKTWLIYHTPSYRYAIEY